MIRKNAKSAPAFRHLLLTVQMLSLFISVLPGSGSKPLAIITYCLAVFSTPRLLIIHGHRYLNGEKDWFWEIIPLVAKTLFFVPYVGLMIYGIRSMDNSVVLFARLLIAYVVTTVSCAQGYYAHCLKVKLNAIGNS